MPRPSISLPVRPTLNASSASPNNAKKGSDSASKAIVAPSSPGKDVERQKRLDALLRDLYNRQLHISSSDTIIVLRRVAELRLWEHDSRLFHVHAACAVLRCRI